MNKETLLGRAICYSILQIGEELSRLRDKFEEEYPNIPWKKVNGLRNLLVHEYAKVDFEQIKYVVNNDLIPLRKQLENLLISLKQ